MSPNWQAVEMYFGMVDNLKCGYMLVMQFIQKSQSNLLEAIFIHECTALAALLVSMNPHWVWLCCWWIVFYYGCSASATLKCGLTAKVTRYMFYRSAERTSVGK